LFAAKNLTLKSGDGRVREIGEINLRKIIKDKRSVKCEELP